jgi:hypothetical protein
MTLLNGMRPSRQLAVALSVAMLLSACVTPPPRMVGVALPPVPEGVHAYPANGQSPEQTDRDRYECHVWAVQETGHDPSRDEGPPYARVIVQPSAPSGSGTAGGALGGAIVGSIIGGPRNAGAGLLLGAATGAIVGAAAEADANARLGTRQT